MVSFDWRTVTRQKSKKHNLFCHHFYGRTVSNQPKTSASRFAVFIIALSSYLKKKQGTLNQLHRINIKYCCFVSLWLIFWCTNDLSLRTCTLWKYPCLRVALLPKTWNLSFEKLVMTKNELIIIYTAKLFCDVGNFKLNMNINRYNNITHSTYCWNIDSKWIK